MKRRTLTDLYNARPSWLVEAHRKLDAAVFAAYGWPVTLTDAELLERLLALNHERGAAKGALTATVWPPLIEHVDWPNRGVFRG